MKKTLYIVFLISLSLACTRKDQVKISGTVAGAEEGMLYLKEVALNTPIVVDSAKLNAKGRFSLKAGLNQPGFYQLGFGEDNFVNLLAHPGDHIQLDFSSADLFANYRVTGSRDSELVKQLDQQLQKTRARLDSMRTEYLALSDLPETAPEKQAMNEKYREIIQEQRRYTIAFVLDHMSSLASIKALYQRLDEDMYVLYEPKDLQFLKIVSDSLKKHYPKSRHTRALLADVEKETSEFYMRQLQDLTRELPEGKLDPVLPNAQGKEIALSSLQGKYVLLYFWSARSEECIAENLRLKQFRDQYAAKGFEIYAINMDVNEELWKNSLTYDELPWVNVREEDPERSVYAKMYNVQTLPANYLIDPKGNIIGKNLFGRNMRIKLEQIFDL